MKKSDIFWQTYLNLEKEALEVSKFIFFTDEIIEHVDGEVCTHSSDAQLETFSPHLADLLIRCCVQIEAVSKELYFEHGGKKARGNPRIYFDFDCIKLLNDKFEASNKTVTIVAPSFNFTKKENQILKPLENAHQKQGTYWEKAYQALKHDRYGSLSQGNVKAFLHALAALYLLNIYYRNTSWEAKYFDIVKADYSFGSSIFSVAPPETLHLLQTLTSTKSQSPFVVKFRNEDEQHIQEMRQQHSARWNEYWKTQPESKDVEYAQRLLQKASSQTHPLNPFTPFIELAKYRLERAIPNDLPFEDRKALLLKNEMWKHLSRFDKNEITPENIQEKINSAADKWGQKLFMQLNPLDSFNYAANQAIIKVYIE